MLQSSKIGPSAPTVVYCRIQGLVLAWEYLYLEYLKTLQFCISKFFLNIDILVSRILSINRWP